VGQTVRVTTGQDGDLWDPGNPENRERTRRLKGELRDLLLQWDPIGVGEAPEAQDEYDGYLGPLLHLLHDGSSVEEVSTRLCNVVEGMGITPRPDREEHFAETLVAWWANATGE
jgi:hypothetical protein